MIRKRRNKLVGALKPLSLIVLLFSLFAVVWVSSNVVSVEYRLTELEKKRTDLMREKKLISAERARLLSIERFEHVAQNAYIIPDRVQVVYVKQGRDGDAYKASFPQR